MYEIISAMITPFTRTGEVNYEEFLHLLRDLYKKNNRSFLLLGSTAEVWSLTTEEKLKIIDLFFLEFKDKSVKCYVNIGEISTDKTISFLKKIDHYPIDAYLIVTPYYCKTNSDGLMAHYEKISQETKKELWIYHIPSRTGVKLTLEEIESLSKLSSIKGIKDCSEDYEILQYIEDHTNWKIYNGNDLNFYQSIISNHPIYKGSISSASQMYFEKMNQILEYKDYVKFQNLEYYLKGLLRKPNPVILKALLTQEGYEVGGVRLPLVEIPFFELECLLKKFGYYSIKL